MALLNGSPAAEAVLIHARSLSSRLDVELILFRVDEPISNLPASRYPDAIRSTAESYLRRVNRAHGDEGTQGPDDPAEVIARFAVKNGVDLIVMAAHGRVASAG